MKQFSPFYLALLTAGAIFTGGCSDNAPTGGNNTAAPVMVFSDDISLSTTTSSTFTANADGSGRKKIADAMLTTGPRGGRILLFPLSQIGNQALYSTKLDGTGRIDFAGSASAFEIVGMTPDGGRIVWVAPGVGADTIMVASIDGSNPKVAATADVDPTSIDISPDGTKIAFMAERDDNEGSSLLVAPLDGSGSRTLLPKIQPEAPQQLTWSSGSDRILFAMRDSAFPDIDANDLWTIRPDGTGLTNLTRDTLDQICPAWSPDGTTIVFTQGTTVDYDLWLMKSDGTGRRALYQGGASEFFTEWSPDGKWILYKDGEKFRTGSSTGVSWGLGTGGVVNVSSGAATVIFQSGHRAYWAR
jgi:Tol biopolymer transport system component